MVQTDIEKKERKNLYQKKYRKTEKGMKYEKKYTQSEKGKEDRKVALKKYRESEKGKKKNTECSWKSQGLNMENFKEIYQRYIDTTNCDNCNCVLTDGKPKMKPNTKCMDHNHETGEFRNILCWKCNIPPGVWV